MTAKLHSFHGDWPLPHDPSARQHEHAGDKGDRKRARDRARRVQEDEVAQLREVRGDYRPRPRTPPTVLAGLSPFGRVALVISIPFGLPPALGTLLETRARLIPSTSPTCFFAVPAADAGLLTLAVFLRELVVRDFFADVDVRVTPALRGFEDADFFAKVPPSSRSNDVRAF